MNKETPSLSLEKEEILKKHWGDRAGFGHWRDYSIIYPKVLAAMEEYKNSELAKWQALQSSPEKKEDGPSGRNNDEAPVASHSSTETNK